MPPSDADKPSVSASEWPRVVESDWDGGWRAGAADFAFADVAMSRALGRGLSPDERALAHIMDELYASEINVRVERHPQITPMWRARLGGDESAFMPIDTLLDWLVARATIAFPQSDFVRERAR